MPHKPRRRNRPAAAVKLLCCVSVCGVQQLTAVVWLAQVTILRFLVRASLACRVQSGGYTRSSRRRAATQFLWMVIGVCSTRTTHYHSQHYRRETAKETGEQPWSTELGALHIGTEHMDATAGQARQRRLLSRSFSSSAYGRTSPRSDHQGAPQCTQTEWCRHLRPGVRASTPSCW